VRSETGRPKRLPSPPVDEADTADIGAVVPDSSSQGGSAPDITSRDISSRGSSFQDTASTRDTASRDTASRDAASRDSSSQDATFQDDSSSDGDGSEPIPQSSWTTTPATPGALDVPADSAAPPVKLKFTGNKPERTQTADADAKPVETSAVVPEAREADPVEDLEPKSPPSPSSGLLADDPAEITPAAEIIGSTPPDVGLADDAAADVVNADDAGADVVNADVVNADVVNADVVNEAAADDTGRSASPQVRILSGTKRYHRPDCALIEDIGDEAEDLESVTRDEAKERGCTPCLVCQPDKEHTAN
jgi:hypothetical protein